MTTNVNIICVAFCNDKGIRASRSFYLPWNPEGQEITCEYCQSKFLCTKELFWGAIKNPAIRVVPMVYWYTCSCGRSYIWVNENAGREIDDLGATCDDVLKQLES